MKEELPIRCEGHDCHYALEQAVLMLLPAYRPFFTDSEAELSSYCAYCVSRLAKGKSLVCETDLTIDGKTARGRAVFARNNRLAGYFEYGNENQKERLLRYLVIKSFFKAYTALTGFRPPWGSLCGVRPAKVAERLLRTGMNARQAKTALHANFGMSASKADICMASAKESFLLQSRLSGRDTALYVGIPFCPSRCAYCSFISRDAANAGDLVEKYMDALGMELAALGNAAIRAGYRIRSVYIGGGTPTVLSEKNFLRLLSDISGSFDLSGCFEYTAEAGRPDTINREKLEIMREYGVTRISVNPQTINNEVLERIGRRHTAEQFFEAYELVKKAGFAQINTDFIAGLPGESIDSFLAGIEKAIILSPDNITVHTMAIKKGAKLADLGTDLQNDNVLTMLERGAKRLNAAGYRPYYVYRQKYANGGENTGWMKPGKPCAYNIMMMEELTTILSAGAGATTKIIAPSGAKCSLSRISNPKYPNEYVNGIDAVIHKKILIGDNNSSMEDPCIR